MQLPAEMGWELLRWMQRRDFRALNLTMDCAKDQNFKKLESMALAFTIPMDHLEVLDLLMPELQHPDKDISRKAWKAFSFMPESLPYKPNKDVQHL